MNLQKTWNANLGYTVGDNSRGTPLSHVRRPWRGHCFTYKFEPEILKIVGSKLRILLLQTRALFVYSLFLGVV